MAAAGSSHPRRLGRGRFFMAPPPFLPLLYHIPAAKKSQIASFLAPFSVRFRQKGHMRTFCIVISRAECYNTPKKKKIMDVHWN